MTTEEKRFDFTNWFEANAKTVYLALGALVVGIAGYYAYKNMYLKPRQAEASAKIRTAEDLFAKDSFERALTLPELGFLAIANDYSSTQAGNLAKGYAGICYLQMGKFDDAIAMMNKFSPEGRVMPATKLSVLGDAHSEKGDFGKAADYYKKAAQAGDVDDLKANNLKKAGLLAEYKQNDIKAALECYKELKAKFPTSADGRDIEKYIARAEAKVK